MQRYSFTRLKPHCPLLAVFTGEVSSLKSIRADGPVICSRRYSTQQHGQEEPLADTPTQRSRWKGTPDLPYINQQDILETLDTHINSTRLKHVLLIWGAKSVGKTGALLTKAAEWEKRGHPVIEVDLKGFDGTLDTFASMLQNATIAALKRHKLDLPEELLQKALKAQQFRTRSATSKTLAVKAHMVADRLGHLLQSIPQVGRAYFGYLFGKTPSARIFKPAVATAEAVGPWFKSITAYIGAVMKKPKTADFVSIFELLEEIARLQKNSSFLASIRVKITSATEMSPIVIIREIQRLDNLSDAPELGRQVFSRLFEYFEPRKQGQSHVPVIIETSDFLWARMKQILSSQESFKAKQMGPWRREEAEDWLVKRTLDGRTTPVFTQEEFNKIWDFSGGHAGTIYFIHSGLIAGTSLDQTIDEYRLEVDGIVRNVVRDGQVLAVITKRKDFLRQLRSSGYKLEAPDEPSGEMMYFLQSNILFSDGVSVFPRNKVYADSIDRYLNVK